MSSPESDIEEKFVDLEITEDGKDQKVFNILLLGETGVGKSTFVNSIANYITYKHMDVAEKNELVVLIPSRFTIRDKNKKEHDIQIGSDGDGNEYLETCVSATQGVKTYLFPVWKGKFKVRIIDTPGLGDTRGIEFDENNYNNVLKYVGSLDYLHGICFLLKPSEARRTLFFEYCFSQLLCRLDKPACNNMFFLFTKTRGTNYSANETTNVLETIFSEIKKYNPDVDIPLVLNKNVFCFDNEVFRYLAAKQQNIEYSEEEVNNYKLSWSTSSTNFWNFLNMVKTNNQIPYSPKIVSDITNARNVLGCFTKVMVRISELINNDAGLRTLIENRDAVIGELEELKAREKISATVVHKKYQSISLLVCAADCCIENYKIGAETQKHYKTVCHWECEEVLNADKEVIGHPQLVNCFAINEQTRQCTNCKCDFSAHLLVDYQTMLKEDYVLDPDITKQISKKESLLRSSLDVISDLQRKHYELKQEGEQIKEVCNKLASFIRKIAIIPFNHSYSEYVEQCIRREQSSLRSNQNSIEFLRKLLHENEELKKIFEDTILSDEAVSLLDSYCSFEEIKERYNQLFNLKYNGKLVRELLSKDDILIENGQTVPEYEHIITFKHKRDRKSKDKKEKGDGDKKKDKKKKEKTADRDGNESDVSCKIEVKERKHRKDKSKYVSSGQNKDDQNQHKETHKTSKKNSNQTGNEERTVKSDNVPRSRTPPPPYSHIWTPSEGSKTFSQGSYPNYGDHSNWGTPNNENWDTSKENWNTGTNVAKGTDPTFEKYEIRVSVKEKVNNPIHPKDFNNYPRSNSPAYPQFDCNQSYQGYPPNPRGPPPNLRGPPPNPRYPPPNSRYPPPNSGYPPPNQRYPPPHSSYPLPNPTYPPSNPRYPPNYQRHPMSNPRFPSYDGRFPPPNVPLSNSTYPTPNTGFAPYQTRQGPGYGLNYYQGGSANPPSQTHKTKVVYRNNSHKPKSNQENEKRHENKIKNDGHIKKAKDSIKQGKSSKESSGGEKIHKKKNKDDKKDGKSDK